MEEEWRGWARRGKSAEPWECAGPEAGATAERDGTRWPLCVCEVERRVGMLQQVQVPVCFEMFGAGTIQDTPSTYGIVVIGWGAGEIKEKMKK